MKDKQDRFEELAEEIIKKKEQISDFVKKDDIKSARKALKELKALNKQYEKLKKEIQGEAITDKDVHKLRGITPKRKSVQNMTDIEVSQTPKFEKLLYTELGEKSPYEMRNGKTDWRNDSSKTVPVIMVANHITSTNPKDVAKNHSAIPQGTFLNRDTGISIDVFRKGIEETAYKAGIDAGRHIPIKARLAALYQMKDIIENAIYFDSKISDYGENSRRKSPNTLFMHKMHAIVNYNNKFYLANISVEEFYSTEKDNTFRNTQNRFYCLRDIEITPVKLMGGQTHTNLSNTSKATSTGVMSISIPQLYQIVKTYDKSFFENPDAIGRADRESELKAEEKFGEAEAKLQATEELVEALHNAEKYKAERDILRGKIDEVNKILEENPLLRSEYKAARDKHRNPPPRDHHIPPELPKPPKPPKPPKH